VWFVGDYGTIRHVTPNHAWAEIVDCPVDTHLRAVWGSSASDVWFVGDAGTILHWDGTTVEEVSGEFSVGRKPDLSGVWGSGTNDVWIAGDAVMLHFTGPKPGMRGGEP
jgi:hypothetical protein